MMTNKTYLAPAVEMLELEVESALLAASIVNAEDVVIDFGE